MSDQSQNGTTTKRLGYATEDAAYQAARRFGCLGLTGGGQQCLPVELPDGSWAYWTAHNYFHPGREPGTLLLPRGREIDPTSEEAVALFGADWLVGLGMNTPEIQAAVYGFDPQSGEPL